MVRVLPRPSAETLANVAQQREASIDDLEACNTRIRHCIRLGKIHEGEAILNSMESYGVSPDVVSFNLILNSYASNGDVQRASALLESMIVRNVRPNDVTYATLCKVLAYNGQVAEIEKFMDQLRERNVELNIFFYGALISACGRCEPPDAVTAERAFSELVQHGLRPQSVKRCLARAVGVTRASALISRACHYTMRQQVEAPPTGVSHRNDSFKFPSRISPAANDFCSTAPVLMHGWSGMRVPEIIRLRL
mmetsp:Transcript_40007/g.87354  ORF Transcript_40007/g.87354 Transcript_40007/m.87354 type:complete len:251 (+) Transcript_40007:82-834(+)